MKKIFKPSYDYRRAGIMLSGLVPSEKMTARLYDENHWERFRKVLRAMDEVNKKWGRGTVRFGLFDSNGNWAGKQTRRSPRYTTRFNEIGVVK